MKSLKDKISTIIDISSIKINEKLTQKIKIYHLKINIINNPINNRDTNLICLSISNKLNIKGTLYNMLAVMI